MSHPSLQCQPREIARWQKAQQLLLGSRFAPALSHYRDLLKRFPDVAQLWFELGLAEAGELNYPQADSALSRAAELAANDVSLLVLIGEQYFRLRRLERARACYQSAVAADPGSLHALLSLAAWWERERRLGDAWECVETCVARHPQAPQAHYYRAFLLHRQGRNEEAAAALRDLIQHGNFDLNVKISCLHLLGVVLDHLGQHDEALRWLCEAKSLLYKNVDTRSLIRDYDRWDRWRRELLAAMTPETIRRWRQEAPPAVSSYQPAFLGGHPRSGTTLLEQILGAHPDIQAFDEPEAFPQEVLNKLTPAQSPKGLKLTDLNALSAPRRAEIRARYLKSLLRETAEPPATKILLDKNPSPTSALHLWLRLFPELKVIIAVRDPRDVIVSCYFQNLPVNAITVNFLTLERAAKHYADLMDVWLRLRDLGGFDWLELRYRDVVANPEGAGRRATEFLGLAWHPRQAAHHETARQKVLHSPTYFEAAKPVFQGSVERWRNFSTALAPVQEKLLPYCRTFGYA